jgi:hypothetical protein
MPAMSFNLPPNCLLKLTKGAWCDVKYPARVVAQAQLSPQDYFEPVDPQSPRSCIPAGGRDFSNIFDSNSGKMFTRGPTMFPPISVTFDIDGGSWDVIFVGRLMQLTQSIESKDHVHVLLTHFQQTVPALLSLSTGLSIFTETVEIAIGDRLEARAETLIPANGIRVIDAEHRVEELRVGIEMLGFALTSDRFILACSYLREALFFDAAYNEHNPYRHSLIVVLKCAQAIEVLFGGKRDMVRQRCRELGIAGEVIESQIIPVILLRNLFGSAHASSFVPSPQQVDLLREFAKRSAHTVRQLLLHISKADTTTRSFLDGSVSRDREKDKLLANLELYLTAPLWTVEGDVERRHILVPDPRLSSVIPPGA